MVEVSTEDRWVGRKEAANYLRRLGCQMSAGHLANLALASSPEKGPRYFKNGARAAYRLVDLEMWWRARIRLRE
jgi:hypothetical protein